MSRPVVRQVDHSGLDDITQMGDDIMKSLGPSVGAAEIARDAIQLIGKLLEFLVCRPVSGLAELKQNLDRFSGKGLRLPPLLGCR